MADASCFFESPNGWFTIRATDFGITGISLSDPSSDPAKNGDHPILKKCCSELSEYFNGNRTMFTVPLDLRGTDFQLKVWRALARIPYGGTTTYGAIAQRTGNPGRAQAVGQIVGNNPIPIILPCHRVLGSNDKLTGFGWGVQWKTWLLRHENAEIGFA